MTPPPPLSPILLNMLMSDVIYGCPQEKNRETKIQFDSFSTFIMTGAIKAGLPPFQLPPFGYDQNETLANSTIGMIKEKIRIPFLIC